MYLVGGLFWVSEVAKGWQEQLEKDYGVPTYGVFILLALATIVVGLSLGGVRGIFEWLVGRVRGEGSRVL